MNAVHSLLHRLRALGEAMAFLFAPDFDPGPPVHGQDVNPKDIRPWAIFLVPEGMDPADYQSTLQRTIEMEYAKRLALARYSRKTSRRLATPKIKAKLDMAHERKNTTKTEVRI